VDTRRQMVRRASDFFRAHASEGVRIGRVSRAAGVSERALRNAFHRDHGISPKQYELRERLHAARQALCDGTGADTVTAIASEHGFYELGRFAGLYKHMFGESPSQTIRAHRRAHPSAG
jgi:AraC-like DNA-binding protein